MRSPSSHKDIPCATRDFISDARSPSTPSPESRPTFPEISRSYSASYPSMREILLVDLAQLWVGDGPFL